MRRLRFSEILAWWPAFFLGGSLTWSLFYQFTFDISHLDRTSQEIPAFYGTTHFFAPVFASMLLLIVARGLWILNREWNSLKSNAQIFLVFQTTFWLALALIFYPGFFSYDSFSNLFRAGYAIVFEWQSRVYSLLCMSLFQIDRHLFILILLHLFIWVAVLYKILQSIQSVRSPVLICFSVMTALPLFSCTLLFLNRDTLFALLTIYLLFDLIRFLDAADGLNSENSRTPSLQDWLKWLFLLFATSELRQDAKIYLVVFPWVLWLLQIGSGKRIFKFTAAALLISLTWNSFGTFGQDLHYKQRYQISAFYHPLNALFFQIPDAGNMEQRQKINKVIPLQSLTQTYDPYSIKGFHNSEYHAPVSSEEFTEFRSSALQLIYDHFQIYLAERWSLFLAAWNWTPHSYYTEDSYSAPHPFFEQIRKDFNLNTLAQPLSIRSSIKSVWDELQKISEEHFAFRMLFFSPISFLILSLIFALKTPQWRRFYLVGILLIASRFPLVFLFSPEPHLGYYLPVLYFSAFFLLLFTPKKRGGRTEDFVRG